MNLDRYLSFLEQWLTPKRLLHSLGVSDVMADLAEVYNLDRERAVLAGLFHDAAKDLPPDLQVSLVMEGGIEIHYPCDRDWSYYLHGPAGAYFVRRELGLTDTLILDAIVTHTYYGDSGSTNFISPLAWCLRFADILEPSRDWSGVRLLRENESKLRELAYAGHLEEAALLQTRLLVEWFGEDATPVHPNMKCMVRIYTKGEAEMTPVKDIKPTIGSPATSALHEIGVHYLEELSKYSKKDILKLHGVGPKAVGILEEKMAEQNIGFRSE